MFELVSRINSSGQVSGPVVNAQSVPGCSRKGLSLLAQFPVFPFGVFHEVFTENGYEGNETYSGCDVVAQLSVLRHWSRTISGQYRNVSGCPWH